jgi:hypothetical protein
MISYKSELFEHTEGRRIPAADGRPQPLTPGRRRAPEHCASGLGGVAIAVRPSSQLKSNLGLLDTRSANAQSAVSDEVATTSL